MAGFDPSAYLKEEEPNGFDPKAYASDNSEEPSAFSGAGKAIINSLPMVGGVAGGILGTPADALTGPAGTVGGAAIGGYLGTAAKNALNKVFYPEDAPKNMTQVMVQPVVGGAEQGLAQATGESVAPYVAKAAETVSGPVGNALSKYAAKKAVTATGATGVQASKFAPEAGQELLDRGIVGFGNSQAKVSQKATDALDKAASDISDTLAGLDKRGATLDQSDVVTAMKKRAAQLAKDPANFDVADSLSKKADRIQALIDANNGNSHVPLSEAEATKRGFQANSNYNSSPLDLSTNKEAANIYRQAVEDAATKFDPESADVFKSAKKTYGLLNPIQEAAAKRASTLAQSPHGGLLDTAAIIAGEGIGGAPGAVIAPMARRAISTRIPSTLAASANAANGLVQSSPALAEGATQAAAKLPLLGAASDSAQSAGMSVLPAAAKNDQSVNRSPARGEDLWAQQGLSKLGIQDPDQSQALLSNPKLKTLLIQASDLSPGSKAFKNIQMQIQKGWGGK